MLKSNNALELAETLKEYWSPIVIDEVDNHFVKIAKLKGVFTWHSHAEQDELFFILNGKLDMQYREKIVSLKQGDLHVVPKGVEHNPVADEECVVLLIERKDTLHTGETVMDASKSIEKQLANYTTS